MYNKLATLLGVVLVLQVVTCTASSPFNIKQTSEYKLFSKLDVTQDGALQWNEWQSNVMTKIEAGHGESEEDIAGLQVAFNRIDTNTDGEIDIDEFFATLPRFGQSVEQVHLALGNDSSEMMVVWVTDDNTTTSEVLLGTTSGSYPISFYGYTTTYDVGEFGGWHKIIHVVKVSSLSPSTTYYYKCGDASGGYSSEYYFTTPPPTATPVVYGLVADMGTYIPLGFAVAKQLTNDRTVVNFSLIIHAGDIAYAGTSGGGEIEETWDVWFNLIQPVAAYVPWMVAIGNHEDYYNRTSFMHRFYMPNNNNNCGGQQNLWYSYDHGNVHWIFFSTQDAYTPGSPQYIWLQQDLIKANSNRGNVAWIVFVTHRPMYCSDTDEESQHIPGAAIQVALEPILVQYAVDIYFCGHMHMYERINPVINGTTIQTATNGVYKSPKAPMHLVIGTAGAFTDHKYIEPQPSWSAVRNGEYGYGRLTVYNNSALFFEYMQESNGNVNDQFWLVK